MITANSHTTKRNQWKFVGVMCVGSGCAGFVMCTDEKNSNRIAIPATDMEQNSSHAPVAKNETTKINTLVDIHVVSYRRYKHDPDGISVKAVLDGIVHAGILADDSTEQVKSITFESRKSKEEKTIIEIEEV